MGVFVFLPLVLPLTAWPIARLAEQHLHPRAATWLLSAVAGVLALCSTLCLALLMVVGTAQLPGNPLPDGWSDPEVREAVPYDEVAGKAAIPALIAVLAACARTVWRHHRVRRRAERALAGLPATPVAVLPDELPYAYALPGSRGTGSWSPPGCWPASSSAERRALFAHERAHLAAPPPPVPAHRATRRTGQPVPAAAADRRHLLRRAVGGRGGGHRGGQPAHRGTGDRQGRTGLPGRAHRHARGTSRPPARCRAGSPPCSDRLPPHGSGRRSSPRWAWPPGQPPRAPPSRRCPRRTRPSPCSSSCTRPPRCSRTPPCMAKRGAAARSAAAPPSGCWVRCGT